MTNITRGQDCKTTSIGWIRLPHWVSEAMVAGKLTDTDVRLIMLVLGENGLVCDRASLAGMLDVNREFTDISLSKLRNLGVVTTVPEQGGFRIRPGAPLDQSKDTFTSPFGEDDQPA